MKLIIWLIAKVIQIIEYVWLIAAMIPLLIGIIMVDILLKIYNVEKVYLLITDFGAWCALISEHLKNRRNPNNKNNTGDIHYV